MFGIEKIWEKVREHEEKLLELNFANCDTCKCLINKGDAIKGESRIVNRVCGDMSWHNDSRELRIDISNGEEIEEVYYCHKCGGKNDTKTKSNRVSKKGSKKTG